jgi:site-specific DNA-methyltransferase (adenine-specific)
MDTLIERYPDGLFDMIFADPPYFLSNGGITCHSGKMVKVDKGDWDKSNGAYEDHKFNLKWLSRCQKLLKKTVLYGFLELITLYILLGLLCNN